MKTALKMALAVAVVVAVAVAGINLLPRDRGGIGRPSAVASSPAVSPSPTSTANGAAGQMTVAGTESTNPLVLSAEFPAGWVPERYAASRGGGPLPPDGMAFVVSLVDNTFKDPCTHAQRTPKVGTSVEALATALGEVPNTTATKPVQATIAGHTATYIELTIPASLPCQPHEFYLWQDSPNGDWWAQGLNELIQVWILEVRGQRVAIAAHSWPGTSQEAKTELQRIFDSIVFVTSSQPSTTPAAS